MSDEERLSLRAKQIVEALEQKDREAIISIFSEDAQAIFRADENEKLIDELFNYFQGAVLGIELGNGAYGTGMIYRYVAQGFIVHTTAGTYYFNIVESQGVAIDLFFNNSHFTGLYALSIKKGGYMGAPNPIDRTPGVFIYGLQDSNLEE
jgi:hypothetical protein